MSELRNGYLAAYIEQNALLAKTLVVKFEEAALLMNEGVAQTHGSDAINTLNPRTWKYYQNLAGQYHSTDTMMSVISIDTLQPIEFTVDNLRIHTATAEAYRYGTRYYNTLLLSHPAQELLINGILTPADLDEAIAAKTGTILAYQRDLVEPNEITLIRDLENYLKQMTARWLNAQFAMSDNLYCTAFFTTLMGFAYPKLLNLRQHRCKTNEAHSFHIRMYLASHSGLDTYLPYMTRRQALWFYRNIAYLQNRPGLRKQFDILVKKLLTDRGIPLAEYSMRLMDDFQDYIPATRARLKPLNQGLNVSGAELQDLDEMLEKQYEIAPGNQAYIETHRDKIEMDIRLSNSSAVQTKALDSTMVDYTNAVPEPFSMVALRQWCYMANNGLYDVTVNFKDPRTQEQRMLFAKDAFMYMLYVQWSSEGMEFTEFPNYFNAQQRRHPKPTVADILSVTAYKERKLQHIAEAIISRQPTIQPCFSVSAFYKLATKLTDEAYWHWFLISSQHDLYLRAEVDNMCRRLYEDERVALNTGAASIEQWLYANNLPVFDYDRNQSDTLVKAIYEAATGLVVDNTKLLKNIQKAMIDLLLELSSYSILVTRQINEDDIIVINTTAIRHGNPSQFQQSTFPLRDDVRIIQIDGGTSEGYLLDLYTSDDGDIRDTMVYGEAPMDIHVTLTETLVMQEKNQFSILRYDAPLQMDISYPGQDDIIDEPAFIPGMTLFNALSDELRQTLKSKYN